VNKVRREQLEYSSVYYCQNLKRKFIRNLVVIYNDTIDEKQNSFKASQHYYERSVLKYWNAVVEGVKTSKHEKQSDNLHTVNLMKKSIKSLAKNSKIVQKKKELKKLQSVFMHNRTSFMFKHCFYTWKHSFDLQSYYKKVIQEFTEYKVLRTGRSVFKAIKVEIGVSCFFINFRKRRD
jgi:hypothetical protein